MLHRNPFREPSKAEIADRKKEEKAANDLIKSAIEKARNCLRHEDFLILRDSLETDTRALIKILLESTESDPLRYAFFCKAVLNKLSVLYDMIDELQTRANRRVAK